MNILEALNNGSLHNKARASRPQCVDHAGNIHGTPERAAFVNWFSNMKTFYGDDVSDWPVLAKKEYDDRYVPSH